MQKMQVTRGQCPVSSAKFLPTRPLKPTPTLRFGRRCRVIVRSEKLADKAKDAANKVDRTAEEVTEKYGLEAGLWKVFRGKGEDGKGKGIQAKDLLKRYGSAYLITSISLSVVSFGVCYILVSSGLDVAGFLGRLGLTVSGTSEKVGAVAIAYAAHKALSPVRFPPTVILTPVVAKILGKEAKPVEGTDTK